MPLTEFQSEIARLLAVNRDSESHLAGGAALHMAPNSQRYSKDLDYFHDSDIRVAKAFEADTQLLRKHSFILEAEINQPGYIRAQIDSN